MIQKIKKAIVWILPPYAYIPLALVVGCNCLAYYFTKLVMANAKHYDLSIFIDDWMPLTAWFISFYILSYVQWFWNYIVHSRQDKITCYRIVMADLIAKLSCLVFFVCIPTEINRPEIVGDGIWEQLTRFIYSTDTPRNLFPSIHCLESYLCFRGALLIKKAPKWYAPAQLIFAIFVFLSTVYVKQHFFVDIIGGIAVVELGWFLTSKFKLWRWLEKIELPIIRRTYGKIDTSPEKEG